MSPSIRAPLRADLVRRFGGYWRMEAGNVVLVPGLVALVAHQLDAALGPATWAGAAAASFYLLLGAAYWRAKYHLVAYGTSPAPTVRLIARSRRFALVLLSVAAAVVALAWLLPGLRAGTVDLWAGTLLLVAAGLEEVNYFHVQLQHFDRAADFRRLLSGRGFRRAHLRRDLAALAGSARA
jgi:hypothetical protein